MKEFRLDHYLREKVAQFRYLQRTLFKFISEVANALQRGISTDWTNRVMALTCTEIFGPARI
jgi:hypothetical protein